MRAIEVEFYKLFWKLEEEVLQFERRAVKKALLEVLPPEIRGLPNNVGKALDIAEWVFKNMTWDYTQIFGRTNDVLEILNERKGRCGEYANLCTGLLRSAGFDARLVFDLSDHLWSEAIIGGEWIPIDPSVAEHLVEPLNREQVQKKVVTYVIGFHRDYVEDITSRYVSSMKTVLPFRKLDPFVEILCATYNMRSML